MPSALPSESDAESAGDDLPKNNGAVDTPMNDEDQEGESEEDDGDAEIFVVEALYAHRSDFEDGQMRYQVKWKGYDKKSDRTWETEENLEGAREILEGYWTKIGGRPTPEDSKPAKKRGRQSTGSSKATPDTTSTKKQKTGRPGRKSKGDLEQDVHTGNVGFTEVGDDDWKPPVPKAGSWDPQVQSIDTVVRESTDGELWGYLIWNKKNDAGRYYRSKARLPVIYNACPQRMLHFYEKHLVFSTGNGEEADSEAAK